MLLSSRKKQLKKITNDLYSIVMTRSRAIEKLSELYKGRYPGYAIAALIAQPFEYTCAVPYHCED